MSDVDVKPQRKNEQMFKVFKNWSTPYSVMLCSLVIRYTILVTLFALGCSNQLPRFLSDSVQVTPGASACTANCKRRLTFNNSASSQNLTDFPALIRVTSTRINYSCMQANGADLRFYDSDDATALKFEIEKWDTSGESIVWVRVPQIDASSTTDSIVMRYCTGGADAQNKTATWDANFAGVWHMSDFSDSTSNANNATNFGSTSATGKIGVARQVLVSGTQYLTAPSTGMIAAQGTVEVWGNAASSGMLGTARFMFAHWSGGADRIYVMQRWNSNPNDFVTGLGSQTAPFSDSGADLTLNEWSYCVLTWNGSAFSSYHQGSLALSATASVPSSIQPTITFGAQAGGGTFHFDGRLDEIRVSNTARSPQWIDAQYRSMNDTLISFGTEYQ